MAEVLRHLPPSTHPKLLVGLDTFDDAGVFVLSEEEALVQTIDFFTPLVDDPYAYGAIAAANALSDVYAMGGRPITVMNIACFDPKQIDSETWAQVLKGAHDKTSEAGALVVGGHSIRDAQPKFGLSVTGLVNPQKVFSNKNAMPGDRLWLSKPLGTGIVTTAFKRNKATEKELEDVVRSMVTLNQKACEAAHKVGVRCATDITGFGLAGHLFNIARASQVTLEINSHALPVFDGVERMVREGCTTGGGQNNRQYLEEHLLFEDYVSEWMRHVVVDPQTSGGLLVLSRDQPEGFVCIGQALEGPPRIYVR